MGKTFKKILAQTILEKKITYREKLIQTETENNAITQQEDLFIHFQQLSKDLSAVFKRDLNKPEL